MKMKPFNIVLSLITGTIFVVGAIIVIILVVVPTTFRDYSIRRGNGTQAIAVVVGYRHTTTLNDSPRYALDLLINTGNNLSFPATTDAAFSRSDLVRRGIWETHEPEVIVRYIGTRAVLNNQPVSIPGLFIIVLLFGAMGVLIIIATIYNVKTGKQLISDEFANKYLKKR